MQECQAAGVVDKLVDRALKMILLENSHTYVSFTVILFIDIELTTKTHCKEEVYTTLIISKIHT